MQIKSRFTPGNLSGVQSFHMKKHRHAVHARVIFWGVGGLLETL